MKTLTLTTALLTIPFIIFSQKEESGLIERDDHGNISSAEFSSAAIERPRSANDFFVQYLETDENDRFEKVSSGSKQADFLHERYEQYYKGIKVSGGVYNFHYRIGQDVKNCKCIPI